MAFFNGRLIIGCRINRAMTGIFMSSKGIGLIRLAVLFVLERRACTGIQCW